MKEIKISSFGKINLSLDVLGLLENGYHELSMVMQQILLHDDVTLCWNAGESDTSGGIKIELSTNRHYLPTDRRNLAYRAAELMINEFGQDRSGAFVINIKKRIPVAAGLAGGSSNAAAVLHGINILWDLGLTVKQLNKLGEKLGSDIPFCIMGQAAADLNLKEVFAGDPLASHCALATGTGTELEPIPGLKSHLVLSKPNISVSTAEVYKGIDGVNIPSHPDNEALIKALKYNDIKNIKKNIVNVLENYTITRYPIVMYTKDMLMELCSTKCVLMSGSGPTVFGLCKNIAESRDICNKMLEHNRESFWTRTTW